MSKRGTTAALKDIIEAIDRIQRYVKGLTEREFLSKHRETGRGATESGGHRRGCAEHPFRHANTFSGARWPALATSSFITTLA